MAILKRRWAMLKNRLRRKRVKALFGTMDFATGKSSDVWYEPHPAGVVFVGSGAGEGESDAEFLVWNRDAGYWVSGPAGTFGPYGSAKEARWLVECLVKAWMAGNSWSMSGL
jgi:hypothetical protein